jgi:hypothetical protein
MGSRIEKLEMEAGRIDVLSSFSMKRQENDIFCSLIQQSLNDTAHLFIGASY